jgi:hypothetical protein
LLLSVLTMLNRARNTIAEAKGRQA